MKINWNQNPLFTTVEVDERDKKLILLGLQNEEYSEILCYLDLFMKEKNMTIDQIHEKIKDWKDICNMEENVESEVRYVVDSLQGVHGGDCTCVPCSCLKCHAESLLGIDTIEGLGKHSARKIFGAFGGFENNKTIDEAIASLSEKQEYVRPDTWPDEVGWDVHIPRWEKEREAALKWLKDYKQEHGF